VPLSTAAVFAGWDGLDRGPLGDWREGRNDLEPVASRVVPAIRDVLDALSGAQVVRLSGSGATCFGLYATDGERDAAAARIRAAYLQWWTLATRLR
jgi:4-diphosphocytidyl-2-C-methyl-D-erythritol kinase